MLEQFTSVKHHSARPLALDDGTRLLLWVAGAHPVKVFVTLGLNAFGAVLVNVALLQLRELPVLGRLLLSFQTIFQVILPLLHLLREFLIGPDAYRAIKIDLSPF